MEGVSVRCEVSVSLQSVDRLPYMRLFAYFPCRCSLCSSPRGCRPFCGSVRHDSPTRARSDAAADRRNSPQCQSQSMLIMLSSIYLSFTWHRYPGRVSSDISVHLLCHFHLLVAFVLQDCNEAVAVTTPEKPKEKVRIGTPPPKSYTPGGRPKRWEREKERERERKREMDPASFHMRNLGVYKLLLSYSDSGKY